MPIWKTLNNAFAYVNSIGVRSEETPKPLGELLGMPVVNADDVALDQAFIASRQKRDSWIGVHQSACQYVADTGNPHASTRSVLMYANNLDVPYSTGNVTAVCNDVLNSDPCNNKAYWDGTSNSKLINFKVIRGSTGGAWQSAVDGQTTLSLRQWQQKQINDRCSSGTLPPTEATTAAATTASTATTSTTPTTPTTVTTVPTTASTAPTTITAVTTATTAAPTTMATTGMPTTEILTTAATTTHELTQASDFVITDTNPTQAAPAQSGLSAADTASAVLWPLAGVSLFALGTILGVCAYKTFRKFRTTPDNPQDLECHKVESTTGVPSAPPQIIQTEAVETAENTI